MPDLRPTIERSQNIWKLVAMRPQTDTDFGREARRAPFGVAAAASNVLKELDCQYVREVCRLRSARRGLRRCLLTRVKQTPFWRHKSLAEMTDEEWESLCDGCGRCCLAKLEEEDTGRIYFTDVGCRLLDGESCRCRDYQNRSTKVDDCVRLTAKVVEEIGWLPPTCA